MPTQEVQPWWYIKHALWNIWLLNAAIYISWQGLPDQSCEAPSNNNTRWPVYSRMFQGTVWWMPLHCVGVRWTQETAHPPCCSLDTRCWPAHPLYSCHAAAPREEDTIPAQQHSVYFNPILFQNTLQEIMKSVCFSVICAYLTEWWRNDECRVLDPGIPCVNITSHHLASLAQTDDAMKKWVLNEYK